MEPETNMVSLTCRIESDCKQNSLYSATTPESHIKVMKTKEMIPNSLQRLLIVKQILLIKNSMENMLINVKVQMVAKSSLQEKLIAHQGYLEITPSMVPTTGRPHKWCECLKTQI